MNFPIKKILAEAKVDYEKAWLEGKNYFKQEGHLFDLKPQGKTHPLMEFIEEARKAMVKLGFEELILPDIIEGGIYEIFSWNDDRLSICF